MASLTDRMRAATKDIHDTSDRSVNLRLGYLLTSKALYAEAISLFLPIYEELESILLEKQNHSQLKLFLPLLNELRRSHRFKQDINFFLNNDTKAFMDLMKRRCHSNKPGRRIYNPIELQDYIERLHYLANDDPIVLVAYVYHMYMAILAGGFIIKRMVKQAFSLKNNSDDGVQMFCLSADVVNSKNIRNKLKKVVNLDMKISEEDALRIIEESHRVFRQNNSIIATVQTTEVFETARKNCLSYMMSLLLPFLTILLAVAYYVYSTRFYVKL